MSRRLILGALGGLLVLAVVRASELGDADFPAPSPSARHTEKVAAIKAAQYDLVLIGDSITHTLGELGGKYESLKAVWDRHYAPRRALNLGHNGYRTENILWNLQNGELDFSPSPKVVLLLIGTNNSDDRHFSRAHSPEEILAGTKAIVELVKTRHPSTKILLVRIFPRGGDAEAGTGQDIFHSSPRCVETCRRAGELTRQLADDQQVFWIDVNHVFLRPDGTINTDLMPDLLHPNAAGAEAWAQAIEPALAGLMGEPELKAPPGEAAPQKKISLWNGPAPVGPGKYEIGDAVISLHRPAQPNGAAVIICPGGGYGGLVTGAEGSGIAHWLNQHGITGVVLEYRLPRGRALVPLLDAQRAIRTARAKSQSWGIDPARIGIIGFSAGGHLASTSATHFDDGDPQAPDPIDRLGCRPDFAILIYPVISMGEKGHGGSKLNLLGPNPTAELARFFSSERQVTDRTPPTFLAHAIDDQAVTAENSRMFHEALQARKVATEYLELPSGGHGLNGYQGPMWDAWRTNSLKWLARLKIIP